MKGIVLLWFSVWSWAGFGQSTGSFEKGNQAYADGNYQAAILHYQEVLTTGNTSAALHYNLGNAHYKLNHIAPSIYHYEKALMYDPGDEDIRNNLELARNMTLDGFEEKAPDGLERIGLGILGLYSVETWGWIAITCMLLFVLLFLSYYFHRRSFLKRIFFLAGGFFLLFSVGSAAVGWVKMEQEGEARFAIVFAKELSVKAEPDERADEVFTLHEGTKVSIKESFQKWMEIELPNGSQGWVPENQVKRL